MAKLISGTRIYGNATIDSNLTVGGNISAENVSFTGNIIHADSGDPVGYIRYLDDIEHRFDGSTKKFLITYDDGIPYDVNNPLQLQIYVGGIIVPPTRYIRDYHNLPEVAVFDHGFYLQKGLDDANAVVISTVTTSTGNIQISSGGNTIVFATAPSSSMDFQAFVRTNSDPQPAFKFKQTPFTALNIMLGP
jgi:hypothetical protein